MNRAVALLWGMLLCWFLSGCHQEHEEACVKKCEINDDLLSFTNKWMHVSSDIEGVRALVPTNYLDLCRSDNVNDKFKLEQWYLAVADLPLPDSEKDPLNFDVWLTCKARILASFAFRYKDGFYTNCWFRVAEELGRLRKMKEAVCEGTSREERRRTRRRMATLERADFSLTENIVGEFCQKGLRTIDESQRKNVLMKIQRLGRLRDSEIGR